MSSVDQRGKDRGRPARRRWRQLFDRVLPLVVGALVVLFVICAVLAWGTLQVAKSARESTSKAQRVLERQNLISVNGCERVQRLRDDQNVTAWGVYTVLNQPQVNLPDLEHLFARVDPATRELILALVGNAAENQGLVVKVRDEQRYLPPTNCAEASRNPRYRFPLPIPFARVARCFDPASIDTIRIEGGRCPR